MVIESLPVADIKKRSVDIKTLCLRMQTEYEVGGVWRRREAEAEGEREGW